MSEAERGAGGAYYVFKEHVRIGAKTYVNTRFTRDGAEHARWVAEAERSSGIRPLDTEYAARQRSRLRRVDPDGYIQECVCGSYLPPDGIQGGGMDEDDFFQDDDIMSEEDYLHGDDGMCTPEFMCITCAQEVQAEKAWDIARAMEDVQRKREQGL